MQINDISYIGLPQKWTKILAEDNLNTILEIDHMARAYE